ncbi:sce7726 family protein [Algoriphagus aquimarinus]|uniref:Sce7726 family protein n=2 Tax=Algoriphagus aquimarinus TaxID=237018 RepID=A0A5C7A8Y8_9BACT|nr:sce7726 family protein [Algoriphagus aquimarinus]
MENMDHLRGFFNAKNFKSYHPLKSEKELNKWLGSFIPNLTVTSGSKLEFLRQLNSFALSHFEDELFFKQLLTQSLFEENIIGAFEVGALTSRLDLLKINGVTTAYEIKSEFDSLEKLEKQSQDYLKLFEYNYLVVADKHLAKAKIIIPGIFGIYTLKDKSLKRIRVAKKNKNLDPKSQLSILTSRELKTTFKSSEPDAVLETYSAGQINEGVKKALKKRYSKKWGFIKERSSEILPLDYQYFFNHPVSPSLVYS